MATAYLIDIDTLKKKGYVQGNVENSIIVTSLTRVQDTMLRPIIGTPFFKRLLEGVDADDLNADEEALLNEYIAPVLISGVDYKIVPHLKTQLRSKTVGSNRDEHITSATETEEDRLRSDLRKDFEIYRKSLIGFLQDNEDLFPEYKDYVCSNENTPPETGKTFTPIRFV